MQKTIFDDMHDAPDKDLFQYVASRLQVEEWEAIKLVNDFSYELKNKLKEGDEVIWDKVGVLRSDLSGSITLEAKTITYDFMEPVPAKRIIRINANHTILRGDTEVSGSFNHPVASDDAGSYAEVQTVQKKKWWIWACALGGAALLLVLLHFYRTGFTLNSLHNIQKTTVKEPSATYLQSE